MANSDRYRFVPLRELLTTTADLRPLPSDIYRRFRRGSMLKLQAEALGQAHKVPERIWVFVESVVDLPGGDRQYKGRVDTHTEENRRKLHTLGYGMMVEFKNIHILDVLADGGTARNIN